MFRPIRLRAGFTDFCPYNTPLRFVNHTPRPMPFQWVTTMGPFVVGSYADRHNTRRARVHIPSSGLRTPVGPR